MSKETRNHVNDFWDSQGEKYGDSHWVSWGDNWMIALETEIIASHLRNADRVLDVGCANGYCTFKQYENNSLSSIIGLDYSSRLIDTAKSTKASKKYGADIDFVVGDVRKLDFQDETFDITYTSRVLINLLTWKEQKEGIAECLRVTKPGGKIIFSEAFWEPLVLLNSLRTLLRLSPLIVHDFNRYIRMDQLKEHLEDKNLKYHIEDFSSIYYLGSRFLRELVTDIDSYPGFTNPINEIFYNIERDFSGGGFGIQQAVVIEK